MKAKDLRPLAANANPEFVSDIFPAWSRRCSGDQIRCGHDQLRIHIAAGKAAGT